MSLLRQLIVACLYVGAADVCGTLLGYGNLPGVIAVNARCVNAYTAIMTKDYHPARSHLHTVTEAENYKCATFASTPELPPDWNCFERRYQVKSKRFPREILKSLFSC